VAAGFGSPTASWSATSGYKREVKYYEKNSEGEQVEKVKTVTDWRPSSGQVAGEFRVRVFAGSHLGIHDEMIRFASEAAYAEHDAEPFDSVATAGFNLMDFSGDEEVLWHAAGESKATAIARAQIVRQIPGDEHKDLQHHLFWDRQPARKVYLPCWFVAYKYKDQSFHACLDGRNAARIDGVRPEDQARKAQVKEILPARARHGGSGGRCLGAAEAWPVVLLGHDVLGGSAARRGDVRRRHLPQTKADQRLARASAGNPPDVPNWGWTRADCGDGREAVAIKQPRGTAIPAHPQTVTSGRSLGQLERVASGPLPESSAQGARPSEADFVKTGSRELAIGCAGSSGQ
jgi:hypothetical protein